MLLDPNRFFSSNEKTRAIANALYNNVVDLPIISPHGHCDPRWFAQNEKFPDPSELFVIPDHYIFRMLVSHGYSLNELGIGSSSKNDYRPESRDIWKIFSDNFYLFRGTPSAMWLNYSFEKVFGISKPLNSETGEFYFDFLEDKLNQPDFYLSAF